MAEQVERTLAQFFFEVGFGACWAQAYIANGETAPFALTDAGVERAWEIAGESHDDPAEFDCNKALADAAPDLLEACQAAEKLIDDMARFIGQMSLRDYAAFNDVPIKLRRAIARTSTDGGRDG